MKEAIILILFAIAIITSGAIIYENLPGEMQKFKVEYNYQQKLPINVTAPSKIQQFYPNMRFNHNNLSYSFESRCLPEKRQNMRKAFSIIHEKTTILSFYEILGTEPDIKVLCSEESFQKQENTFIAGEGGPTKFLNTTIYPVIFEGTIQLYKTQRETEECTKPQVELHELLHVFGFKHLNDTKSIMYPYLSCDQTVNQEFINQLIQLYTLQPKSELEFKTINATKSGRYLSFEVMIENKGIIDSENTALKISAKKQVKEMKLGKLPPGSSKKLTVENLPLPSRSTNKVTFQIITEEPEYDKTNNVLNLEIK